MRLLGVVAIVQSGDTEETRLRFIILEAQNGC